MIGVVGGGIAGLSTAYRLQQRGHEVRVFEASEDLGGLAAVYETAGDPIEKFYHHLSKSEETIVEVIEALGLGDRLEWRYGSTANYVEGEVHPMDKPWEILAYPHLSVYDKFRLGMLVLDVDVRGGVPSFSTYERLEDFEGVPVKEFVLDHTTRGCFENFFRPLLEAKFGDRWEDVSAAWLLGRIKFRGERDVLKGEILGYLEGGFGTLLDALVEAVGRENITTAARVTELEVSGGRVSGLTVETPAEGEASGSTTHDVDAAVVAAMPNVLEALTGYECSVDFQGAVCSVVSTSEPLTDTYWLNVADEAPFGALIEHTNFVSPDRYGGEHLLYAVTYVQSMDDPLWQRNDAGVEETWFDGIERLFPGFDRGSVNWIRTARNPRVAPIYERGYLEKVVPYDLGDEVAEGLYYAGMASRAQYPERSLNGGIVAGFACADRIASRGVDSGTEPRARAD
jgi:protoporphyrinogen oxidase